MPNYKDTSNKVHFLDSAEFEYLLPAGCTEVAKKAIVLDAIATAKTQYLADIAATKLKYA